MDETNEERKRNSDHGNYNNSYDPSHNYDHYNNYNNYNNYDNRGRYHYNSYHNNRRLNNRNRNRNHNRNANRNRFIHNNNNNYNNYNTHHYHHQYHHHSNSNNNFHRKSYQSRYGSAKYQRKKTYYPKNKSQQNNDYDNDNDNDNNNNALNSTSIRPPSIRPSFHNQNDEKKQNEITKIPSKKFPTKTSSKFQRKIYDNADEDESDENDIDFEQNNNQTIQVDNNYNPNHALIDDFYMNRFQSTSLNSFGSQFDVRYKSKLEFSDLSERASDMAKQLKKELYECMICKACVEKKDRIWVCNDCYTIFHLRCINLWAESKEQKDAENESREVKDPYLISTLRCPACNSVDKKFKYNEYSCFCQKVNFDQLHNNISQYSQSIPHSCGEPCNKKRGKECIHPCTAICHPGPCQPCTLPSNKMGQCPCGKLEYKLLCGQLDKKPRLCSSQCEKLLNCGIHKCSSKCHYDNCSKCEIKIKQTCFCGKKNQEMPCGSGQEIIDKNGNKILKFKCNLMCNKLLKCGNHRCQLKCHSGSCSVCPRLITNPTKCACGKTDFPNIIRKNCKDSLPTCKKKCDRMLNCNQHFCQKKCHDSNCPPCNIWIKNKQCRCGSSKNMKFKCSVYTVKRRQYVNNLINNNNNNNNNNHDFSEDGWIVCNKICKRVMSCGIHECKKICCPGRSIHGSYFDGHLCRKICGKVLNCQRHTCNSYCHNGRCPPCGVTYRNGVSCNCGNIFVPGPFQCGTKYIPVCDLVCDKLLDCGHRCVKKCHSNECPKCTIITSKQCETHHIFVHNIQCHLTHVSCGNPCSKLLPCQLHGCQKTCHSSDIQCGGRNHNNNNNNNHNIDQYGCGQICGLKLRCGHSCPSKCHPKKECNFGVCKFQITVKCKCGNSSEKQYCRGRIQYELKAIACTESCQIADRNKRFREALNINDHKNNNLNDHTDNKKRIPFAASVLKRIILFMKKDQTKTRHNKTIRENKEIIQPTFVLYFERFFASFVSDNSKSMVIFKKQYPNINIDTMLSSPSIHLRPMHKEEKFIIYNMSMHYNIKADKVIDSISKKSHIEITKTKHSMIPSYLLSTALIEYQLRSDEIETLESMPPECIIVVSNASEISTSKIQDRLIAWTGHYRMWRNTNNDTLFLCFTDEKLRNSAISEMSSRYNARKGCDNDSINANNALKMNMAIKKKNKSLKEKETQKPNKKKKQKSGSKGWSVKGDIHATMNQMPKQKSEKISMNLKNRFG